MIGKKNTSVNFADFRERISIYSVVKTKSGLDNVEIKTLVRSCWAKKRDNTKSKFYAKENVATDVKLGFDIRWFEIDNSLEYTVTYKNIDYKVSDIDMSDTNKEVIFISLRKKIGS